MLELDWGCHEQALGGYRAQKRKSVKEMQAESTTTLLLLLLTLSKFEINLQWLSFVYKFYIASDEFF